MLSTAQRQKIWVLSDTVLYSEAVTFMNWFVQEEGNSPLPISQVTGLLNIANASKYADLYIFVKHQRDRNWPESRSNIKKLYTELEKILTLIQKKRLKDEFQLVTDGLNAVDARQEVEELMALLAHEFIQHLVAENRMLTVKVQARNR